MQLTTPAPPRRRAGSGAALLLAALPVLVVAVNLRPAVAAVGPVILEIGDDLGLSGARLSLLTAGPVFCMGLFAPLAPALARRMGLRPAVVALLVAIAGGLVARVLAGPSLLLLGTLLAAVGIAVGNVLVPALVRADSPQRIGPLMGLYTVALGASASVASALAAPLADGTGAGWRASLGVWAVPAAVAAAVSVPRARRAGCPAAAPAGGGGGADVRRDPVAWAVTGYFSLQALMFFTTLTWLAPVLRDRGTGATTAGLLLSLLTLVQLPGSLLVPVLAARRASQLPLVAAATGLSGAGLAGLLLLPGQVPALWVVLVGLGQGAGFALALTFIVLRTADARDTADLSAMTQTVGYTAAGVGPLVAGVLGDASGGWSLPLALLLVALALQLVPAVVAARPGTVGAAARRDRLELPPSA